MDYDSLQKTNNQDKLITSSGNTAIQNYLTKLLVGEITGKDFKSVKVTVGVLQINYFSFVFSIEILFGKSYRKLYVKIPKEDLRHTSKSILPITTRDRVMAEAEVASLRTLSALWRSEDIGVSWIRMHTFIPEYNAIVTEAAEGDEAFSLFRKFDLYRRIGFYDDQNRLNSAMKRLGIALARFHQKNTNRIIFRLSDSLPKYERYCNEIEKTNNSFPTFVLKKLYSIADTKIETEETNTFKGIDIRNILIDKNDNLWLLDPGRIKRTCREADLARFIMTYRILYWGSGLFLLRLEPDRCAEQAFLNAYYENNTPPSSKLLSLYLIKEQLKHWWTALDSLKMLEYPPALKKVIEKIYINPYYIRQLKIELQKVI